MSVVLASERGHGSCNKNEFVVLVVVDVDACTARGGCRRLHRSWWVSTLAVVYHMLDGRANICNWSNELTL
eukprot:366421-Chlamydomonas_euryale.AAC.7